MKLHELRPAAGARRPRTRVGRGIAAGQGKTAGRGTKGQKARAGASIPAWFEGGQTPIHIRVPKLRGFKNRFKVEYAVVNVGQIADYATTGRFGVETPAKGGAKKAAEPAVPTVNADVLAAAGLIRGDGKPLKVLGSGEVSLKLFVAAEAFSASARRKIEEAGGFVQVLASARPSEPAEPDARPAADAEPAEAVAPAEAPAPAEDVAQPADEPAPAKPARKRPPKSKEPA